MSGSEGAGLVVVGASLAGLRAVEAARRRGYTGRVTLVGAEEHLPYDRLPLSKQFLAEGAVPDYFVTDTELQVELDVDLRLGRWAEGLDPVNRTVTVDGDVLPFDRLLIATGARPRILPHIPSMPGVVTLRTLDDAFVLREALTPDAEVVVIGAGFIGSEIASSARAKGAHVTIVEAAPVPLVRAVGAIVGEAISGLHESNGTRLLCGVHVDAVIGEERVTAVRLSTGETIPADVVVVGIGAAPATEWLRDSGLELSPVDGGILCDAYLRTSVPGIYAAGDVAHWPNGVMDVGMRLENWTNASDQGAHAALNAVFPETATPYSTVPYFWSDWYGDRIQFVGTAEAASVSFVSGGPGADRFVALYRTDDRVVGVATLNEPRLTMKFRRVISERGGIAQAAEVLSAAMARAR